MQTESQFQRRPRIGLSGTTGAHASMEAFVAQLRALGADVVFLGNHAKRIKGEGDIEQTVAKDLSDIDGLIIAGNSWDIDPRQYDPKAVKHPQTQVETDQVRRKYEELAIEKALDMGMPLLGVCGGLHRMNVMGGGTLHQHVPDVTGVSHRQAEYAFTAVHPVTIQADTQLASIAQGQAHYYVRDASAPQVTIMENSFHHQAVNKVRPDFQVNALSPDGIIEGIEPKPGSKYDGQFALGVQWHPEYAAELEGPAFGPKIFGALMDAAAHYVPRPELADIDSQSLQAKHIHATGRS